MIYTIDEIKNIIQPIAIKYHLKGVYLFGSYARGEATTSSDIDLIVDTTGSDLNSLFKLETLYAELEDAFEKKIDLITLRSLNQPITVKSDLQFREKIKKERISLYAAA